MYTEGVICDRKDQTSENLVITTMTTLGVNLSTLKGPVWSPE